MDGIYLKCIAAMSTISVNDDGYREEIGYADGLAESRECWRGFLSRLKPRGLRSIRTSVDNKVADTIGSITEVLPEARCRRRTARFCRNVPAKAP